MGLPAALSFSQNHGGAASGSCCLFPRMQLNCNRLIKTVQPYAAAGRSFPLELRDFVK
jgi:hypothetical protein